MPLVVVRTIVATTMARNMSAWKLLKIQINLGLFARVNTFSIKLEHIKNWIIA
jgi:hypothetical protein